jgi:hypothetical protein
MTGSSEEPGFSDRLSGGDNLDRSWFRGGVSGSGGLDGDTGWGRVK